MDVHILHYGGPHGEIGASLRYLSQRYAMPYPELRAILTDVGTEELAHLEMVGTIVYQLTRNLTPEQIKAQGFDTYFVEGLRIATDRLVSKNFYAFNPSFDK